MRGGARQARRAPWQQEGPLRSRRHRIGDPIACAQIPKHRASHGHVPPEASAELTEGREEEGEHDVVQERASGQASVAGYGGEEGRRPMGGYVCAGEGLRSLGAKPGTEAGCAGVEAAGGGERADAAAYMYCARRSALATGERGQS